MLLLLSARPDELPETVVSRCHVVAFLPLAEPFVAEALEREGAEPAAAVLAARLSGGNLGRARRIATGRDGLSFRDAARELFQFGQHPVVDLRIPNHSCALVRLMFAGFKLWFDERDDLSRGRQQSNDDRQDFPQ